MRPTCPNPCDSSMSHSISSQSLWNALYLVHIYKWQTYIGPNSKLNFIVLKASSMTDSLHNFFLMKYNQVYAGLVVYGNN
jgi:hypothetical protein